MCAFDVLLVMLEGRQKQTLNLLQVLAACDTWLWLKKPEFQNGLPWEVETCTKTCGLPLLSNFEPYSNILNSGPIDCCKQTRLVLLGCAPASVSLSFKRLPRPFFGILKPSGLNAESQTISIMFFDGSQKAVVGKSSGRLLSWLLTKRALLAGWKLASLFT